MLVINGRVISYNQSLHPYPNIMQVNLYPWARPGQTNRIELWPRTPEETPSFVSSKQGQTYRTFASESGPLPRGTFDWRQRQLTFITDGYARAAIFSFQLRWATGSIWYDDVELEDLGSVESVDTY